MILKNSIKESGVDQNYKTTFVMLSKLDIKKSCDSGLTHYLTCQMSVWNWLRKNDINMKFFSLTLIHILYSKR